MTHNRSDYIGDILERRLSRRHALAGLAGGALVGIVGLSLTGRRALAAGASSLTFTELQKVYDQNDHVAPGYERQILIRWGDPLVKGAPDFDPAHQTAVENALRDAQGDFLVHADHGIARYAGLIRRSVDGVEREYLELQYADRDRLYVPADQLESVSRYVGPTDHPPSLTKLGSQDWARAKRRVKQAVVSLRKRSGHQVIENSLKLQRT